MHLWPCHFPAKSFSNPSMAPCCLSDKSKLLTMAHGSLCGHSLCLLDLAPDTPVPCLCSSITEFLTVPPAPHPPHYWGCLFVSVPHAGSLLGAPVVSLSLPRQCLLISWGRSASPPDLTLTSWHPFSPSWVSGCRSLPLHLLHLFILPINNIVWGRILSTRI